MNPFKLTTLAIRNVMVSIVTNIAFILSRKSGSLETQVFLKQLSVYREKLMTHSDNLTTDFS